MLRIIVTLIIAALPLAALSQSYRCVGKDGKKYYGQSVPPQCTGQPIEQLNAQGLVMRRIDAAATADERAKKEAEAADMKKRAALAKEQGRKDNALLASYTSENDIEIARKRALESPQNQIRDIENRVAALKKKRADPKENAAAIDSELKIQDGALASKHKEVDHINARYDEDKRRFIEIKKGK